MYRIYKLVCATPNSFETIVKYRVERYATNGVWRVAITNDNKEAVFNKIEEAYKFIGKGDLVIHCELVYSD